MDFSTPLLQGNCRTQVKNLHKAVRTTKLLPMKFSGLNFKFCFSIILSIFLLTIATSAYTQSLDPARLQQFEEAILKGEDFFKAGEYAKAKAEYQKALAIDPGAKYPKDKLTQIRKFYIDPEDEARFKSAFDNGNRLFQAGKYDEARDQFSIATNIKPEDKPARDKLIEAERAAQAYKEAFKQYTRLIADADKLYNEGRLKDARPVYVSASEVLPSETYPQVRIQEIDRKEAAAEALKQSYETTLAEADEAYMNRDFTTARLKYEQALKIKPAENYPKSMLERVAEGMAQLKGNQEKYNAAIAAADKLFDSGDFETARSGYQNAASLMPGEKHPAERINRIDEILAQRKQLDENYSKVLAEADKLFAEKKYSEAKTEYQKANDLKPSESYPKQRIEETAQQLLAIKEAERNKNYNDAIVLADKLFGEKNYKEALSAYNEARSIKPEEKWPAEQIAQINKLFEDQKTLENAYQLAISSGDNLFSANRLAEAKAEYQKASGLKPNEDYPKGRIAEIDTKLAQAQKNEADFNAAVTEGDTYFSENNLEKSEEAYRSAISLKPGSKYPADQIEIIQRKKLELQSKEDQYVALVKEGDDKFLAKELSLAKSSYQQALELKPGEKHPADRIALIDKTLEEEQKRRNDYTISIKEADQLFEKSQFDAALSSYQKAGQIIPEENYPNEQIARIRQIQEELKSAEENYIKYLGNGDEAFKNKSYQEAITAYENALKLKPAEKYPATQIELARKNLDALAELRNKYNATIAAGDKNFEAGLLDEALKNYNEAMSLIAGENYPSEQIKKINALKASQLQREEEYRQAIVKADDFFAKTKYSEALSNYEIALTVNPSSEHALSRKAEIGRILGEIELTSQQFETAVKLGDEKFNMRLWDESEAAFKQALKLKPAETYPATQIEQINKEREAERTASAGFAESIAAADAAFTSKEYDNALGHYKQALNFKPQAEHPTRRIAEINSILEEQKRLADKDYYEALEKADALFQEKDYNSAVRFYETATAIKPLENHPKDRILAIRNILQERARNQMEAYNKIILNADRLYQAKVFDQAIDAYTEASLAKPDESYPADMIRKIRKYLEDHTMVDLVVSPTSVETDTEKKFNFTPIEFRLRKNNYISIKARKTSETDPKVYVNYGKGSQKNGGIVLRSITTDEHGDFLVRVSIQDRWYREDNNWIGIYAEGGSIEIEKMQIAQGGE